MKKMIIRHNDFALKVIVSQNNTCIVDSYQVKSMEDMEHILYKIQQEVEDTNMAIHKRSIWGMTNEWRVHNLLYSLGIKRDRTKSVDLDTYNPWYMRIAYTLISPFYFHFE